MFENVTFASGMFEHPLNEYKSVQVTRVLHDFYDSDPQRGFYGGGLDARFDYYPISFALWGCPQDKPRSGPAYKAMLREYYTRTMTVAVHATALPVDTRRPAPSRRSPATQQIVLSVWPGAESSDLNWARGYSPSISAWQAIILAAT